MKAAVLSGYGRPLEVEELEIAPPGSDDLRVRVLACAICRSDVHAVAGDWGGDLPAVYGHEVAGKVIESGSGVEGYKHGDSVVVTLMRHCGACPACQRGEPALCGDQELFGRPSPLRRADGTVVFQGFRTGGFAEEVVVHRSQAQPVPASWPVERAALLGCGVLTGFGSVANCGMKVEGETVAVYGAGGVGINAVQAAVAGDAGRVIVVDPSPEKRSLALEVGASHAVDPGEDTAAEQVADLGGGIDLAVTTVVTEKVFGQALASLRKGGCLVVAGMAPDGHRVQVDPTDLADRGVRIQGCKMGSSRPDRDIPRLVDLHDRGKLRLDSLVSNTYSLDGVNEALEDFASGRSVRNVILFSRDR